MAFQIKGTYQIRADTTGHYNIEWAITALKLLNLFIGLLIWVIVTFVICHYIWEGIGFSTSFVDPAFIPPDLVSTSVMSIILLFIPVVINRVAINDLKSRNTDNPTTIGKIITGDV
jgi:hypothetical protein